MLQLKELLRFLDELFLKNGIQDFCPNGLQVEGKHSIARIATAVSANLATIEAAIGNHADALIVHHGLFWKNDSYAIQGVKREKLSKLLAHGISLIAYHLPLDMHGEVGNNWKAARDLGWTDLEPFGFFNGAGAGVKGKVGSDSRAEFKKKLEKYYQHPATCALGGPDVIRTAALVSGGAYKMLYDAAAEGIDAFITGNFDEPAWHQAKEEKINFYAMGHSATERVGPLALAEYLAKSLPVPCQFIDIENPF